MASLKDINASIEEGNENTEKLNANFSRWLKSQQTSGDDLEAAREKKRTVAVKGGDTFISNKITKGGRMILKMKWVSIGAIFGVIFLHLSIIYLCVG